MAKLDLLDSKALQLNSVSKDDQSEDKDPIFKDDILDEDSIVDN